ncbi:MAG: zinc-binding dehydrogenase [Proteobacteria bacterium]|nr:zinc-binding dehydrogenase [Pseudomonadota bacterium]MDA1059234.1 zinc-binding dehydrogenase [Pseudomonadota bacterium]
MKAIVLHKNGGPQAMKYETIRTPEPGPGEVLIRVYAAGVNHVDIDIRNGISGMAGNFPHILGVDAAGEVAKVGDGVRQWKKGDRVAPHFILSCGVCQNCISGKENICLSFGILGATQWGTYAEYVKVGAHHLVALPDKLDYDQAVSAYVPFATAWEALIEVGKLQAGENVLINAASSGVGSAGIQIAKLAGARVLTTSSSAQKLARAKKLGADVGINYRTQKIGAQARKMTGGLGVDIALEMVGGETLKQTIDALAPGGRIVTVGAHGGEQVDFDMIEFFRKHISMHGCGRSTRAMASHVLQLTAEKKLKPVIHKRFALKDAPEAHKLMESRKFFGRMVLNP